MLDQEEHVMKKNLVRSVGIVAVFATGSAYCESADSKIEAVNARIAENQRKGADVANTHVKKIEENVDVTVPKDSLFRRTSFLTDGRLSVIVPKGAVVSLAGQNRLSEGSRIVGKLVEWDEFLKANRAVIELIEVPGDKLYKPEPIEKSILEKIQKNKLIGVTTYLARPVVLKNLPEPSPKPIEP